MTGPDQDALAAALARLIEAVAASPPPKPKARKLLRVAEVAELLSISETHVRALIRTGEIRAVKLGGAVRIAPTEVDRIMTAWEENSNG